MTTSRAVVAGASGFLGQALVRDLFDGGYDVLTVGRGASADVRWGDADALAAAVDGADVVVNFAGKSVNARYTDRERDEILRSRIATTKELRDAIAQAAAPPAVWINSSTATIYRHAMDRPQTERDGEIGAGFSVNVAQDWEREFFRGELPGTRRVALRMAIVLGDGPATRMLFTLARFGLGGHQRDGWWFPHRRYRGIGSAPTDLDELTHATKGRQRFSWVHVTDVVRIIRFVIASDELEGVLNVAAPGTSDNTSLMREIRRTIGMPIGLPATRFMIEPAMWLLRTEPELVMKSRWVVPERLTEAGFTFEFPELRPALSDTWRALRRVPAE